MSISSTLISKFQDTIRNQQLLQKNDTVIVGVSGGADSLSLLHLLFVSFPKLRLITIYVNHGLRPSESLLEIETIRKYCHAWKIIFHSKTIDVENFRLHHHYSFEKAARILRYNVLEEYRLQYKAQAIAVGHTSDDQVEEFFIRLIRGGSPKALSGMDYKNEFVIRPLLNETKNNLIQYLSENKIEFHVDSSNLETKYLRNKVRLNLVPFFEDHFNPSIKKIIRNYMDILDIDEDFLAIESQKGLFACVEFDNKETITINIESFLTFHKSIQRRVIEHCCWRVAAQPTYDQICAIQELFSSKVLSSKRHIGSGVLVQKDHTKGQFVRVQTKGRINQKKQQPGFSPIIVDKPGDYPVIEISKNIRLSQHNYSRDLVLDAHCLYFDIDKATWPLIIAVPQPGDRFHPASSNCRKKIYRYFNEKGIPATKRSSWPILLKDKSIVAVVGLEVDKDFAVTDKTNMMLCIEINDLV